MKKLFLLLILLPVLLHSQYNEKEILLKQANRYLAQRQYERADKIYEQLLSENPDDIIVMELYVSNLIRMSKIDKANQQLQNYGEILPELTRVKLQTSIYLGTGKIPEAKAKCLEFLTNKAGNINAYRTLAMIFEQYRQYDIAIEIYSLARQVTKDENLYTRELALDYQNLKEYKKAIKEFLKLADSQKGYVNYVLSRLKQILQEDKLLISNLEQESNKYQNDNIQHMVAQCYADIKDFDNALLKYEKLSPELLYNFALNMKLSGEAEIAEKALNRYLEREKDVARKATASLDLAEVEIGLNKLDEAERVLLKIYNDKNLQDARYRYRTKANSQARILLAELGKIKDENETKIIEFLEEAKQFTYNITQLNEIEFKIIDYLLMKGNFEESKKRLQALLSREESGTETFKMGYYYSYLLAMMQNDSAADSLLSEILINLPERKEANDALNLYVVSSLLKPPAKKKFFAAFREKNQYKIESAVDTLLAVFQDTQNEEMLLLAGEWAYYGNIQEKADIAFSYDYKNPILRNYALLRRAEIYNDKDLSRSFLQQSPHSVFSPEFRNILEY